MKHFDVLIIGGGIVGSAAAYYLTKHGFKGSIAIIEKDTTFQLCCTARSAGGIRQQWGSRAHCLLARESQRFYRELPARLDPPVDPAFRECGYVFVAHTAETLERLRGEIALQNELGIPSRLLSPAEAAEVVHGLAENAILGASYCAEDGFVDRPRAVVRRALR